MLKDHPMDTSRLSTKPPASAQATLPCSKIIQWIHQGYRPSIQHPPRPQYDAQRSPNGYIKAIDQASSIRSGHNMMLKDHPMDTSRLSTKPPASAQATIRCSKTTQWIHQGYRPSRLPASAHATIRCSKITQ